VPSKSPTPRWIYGRTDLKKNKREKRTKKEKNKKREKRTKRTKRDRKEQRKTERKSDAKSLPHPHISHL
jgi:hypothetical protein